MVMTSSSDDSTSVPSTQAYATKAPQPLYSATENARGNSAAWTPKRRATVLAVFIASIGEFSLGTVLTFSAPVLADTQFQTKFPGIGNGSWVATTALLGALLSAPVSGILNAKFGRRGTMLISALPFSAGWAMIAFAPNVAVLYAGRFLTGFCGGTFTATVPQYISEVSEDRIRGALGVAFVLMNSSGIVFTFFLGAFVNWFALALTCWFIPILSFLGMLYMPESPRYLIRTDKRVAAVKALKWLRQAPSDCSVDAEISAIEASIVAETSSAKASNVKDLFSPRMLKPVGIVCALMFFGQFSGIIGVALYTVQIFEEAGTGINANLVSIIIGAANVGTVLIVPFTLVEKVGRRSLLIMSKIGMFLSLLALGTFFYLKEQNAGETPANLTWLPSVSLVIITIAYNVGPGTIPWVVTAEILPDDVKELATSSVCIWYWAVFFASGKSFQDAKDAIGYTWVYWISAFICLVGALFVYLLLPETKGKSCSEIQEFFEKKGNSHPENITHSDPETPKHDALCGANAITFVNLNATTL